MGSCSTRTNGPDFIDAWATPDLTHAFVVTDSDAVFQRVVGGTS